MSHTQFPTRALTAAISPRPSLQSWIGLCAVCFFLAEINGVLMPFLATYLTDQEWRYDTIGYISAVAGLVSWVISLPAGILIDRIQHRRLLLIIVSLLVGGSILAIPIVPASLIWIGFLLVLASIGFPAFGPLTNDFTLGLAGHERIDFAMGINQAWNHAGNIAAAAVAMAIVQFFPSTYVFYSMAAASFLAAISVLLIRPNDLHNHSASQPKESHTGGQPAVRSGFFGMLRDRRVVILLASSALFHLANAPVMPLIAQKIQYVGGSHTQIAAVVLVAQIVMVPTSIVAGMLASSIGHKAVLSIGFIVLPIRIMLYSMTSDPSLLVLLQAFDGIGAGIFGVTSVAVCADVTRGSGHFNSLAGALGAASGFGPVVGPLIGGILVQQFGFDIAFQVFAAFGLAAAVLLVGWMPVANVTRDWTLADQSPTTAAE